MTLRQGERLTDNGVVVERKTSRLGLHSAVIECQGKYPPIETWCRMVGHRVIYHVIEERMVGHSMIGVLTLYWKET
jgi:hypothetical protein